MLKFAPMSKLSKFLKMKWERRTYRCLCVKSGSLDKTMKILDSNNALAWFVTRSIYVKEMEINDNIVVNFV